MSNTPRTSCPLCGMQLYDIDGEFDGSDALNLMDARAIHLEQSHPIALRVAKLLDKLQ